jgi:uncharacterized protein (UPF0212 family)
MLSDRRYCPRCDEVTDWTNEADGTLTLVCVGCDLTVQSELTDEEAERLARYEARPVRGRRAYEHV